ncbi:MAG: chromosome partitioning protein, partial [Geodermatophilaceae bacterium]|nr:chromosome partitioning protein [Geodermatophilaceae bacterium]
MTNLPVLTAVTGAVWESELVGALAESDHGLTVVRRCVDLADLLSVASTGTARAVLLSADLRRLDRESVSRLGVARVAVVGLVDAGDVESERRLRLLGVRHVLAATSGPVAISAAVVEAVEEMTADRGPAYDVGDPRAALPDLDAPPELPEPGSGPGTVVAVWGPTGAPGRTTVAVGLADEAARLGTPVLLIDADVYGGTVGQVLGVLDESPGVAAAARQAGNGTLDATSLAKLAWAVSPSLRVLTGITRADRWPELRPSSLAVVFEAARELAPFTVVDCGFCLEQDEEVSYDTVAPRRNAATVAILAQADVVLCVSGADPVSLQRTVRALAELRDVLPKVTPRVVVNRVRRIVVPGDPRREIATALARFANVTAAAYLPQDVEAADSA